MKNKDPLAVALGSRGGQAKNAKLTKEQRNEMMAEVRASRWPKKLHALKKPCTFSGCKITNNHEHTVSA